MSDTWQRLAAAYRPRVEAALAESIVPFWWRAADTAQGGVFTCWNNEGTQLVSRDKFTWSQGRFAWLWSRLAELTRRRLLPGDTDALLGQAERTVNFLARHAVLEDGRCAFLLDEHGLVREAQPGLGPAPSIYADCFVAMGFAEFARVAGSRRFLDLAWELATGIRARLDAGPAPTHPTPVPPGFDAYAPAMIWLNVALVLEDACKESSDTRTARAREQTLAAASAVCDRHVAAGGRLAELRPEDGDDDRTLLARHINPGHALEGAWMLFDAAARAGNHGWAASAQDVVRFALERGWDADGGGLLHFADHEGGMPVGQPSESAYEAGIRANWSAKLWWVHSEALYATLVAFREGRSDAMHGWFERVWEYAFRTFPHPDARVGEWIQIRDRHGLPLNRVVALPVKDPYHVARNLIQILETFAESAAATAPA